jgi:hypothetical protein
MAAAGDGGGGGDGKNPAAVGGGEVDKNPAAFRWIDAARYTVALVVTVLIVSVIVNAIKFVTRNDPLHFSVVGGFVSSTVKLPPDGTMYLDLNVRAQNPSGRARMYYVNITAYLFNGNTSTMTSNTSASTTSNPVYDSMVYGRIPDIVVSQQKSVDSLMRVRATKRSMPEYFDSLYNGGGMSDVTLRLDGNLTTEVVSYGPNANRTLPTIYYCDNLLLGGDKDDEAFKGLPDVNCRYEHPSSMTVHIEPMMMMIQASWPLVFAILHSLY